MQLMHFSAVGWVHAARSAHAFPTSLTPLFGGGSSLDEHAANTTPLRRTSEKKDK
jgi:hypothetical protein